MNPYETDRSRIDTREECERKRYLNYDLDILGDGQLIGIQRTAHSLPLLNGTEMHEAHARVLAGEDLDAVVADQRARYRAEVARKGVVNQASAEADSPFGVLSFEAENLISEQINMLEALLRGFVMTVMPRILEEYDILHIEKPMIWELAPGLIQNFRFDVTARRKGDGQLVILDWKSMPYVSDAWGKKLERSRQTTLYIEAAEELYGEPVEMGYVGLVKGVWRKDTAKSSPWYGQKIQSSPLLYAYALTGNAGTVYQTAYTSKKGYRKVRTYEEMTIKEWMAQLKSKEPGTLNELFTFVPPFAPTLEERREVRELIVKEELEYVENIRIYHDMRDAAIRRGNEVLEHKAMKFLNLEAAPKRENTCFKYGEDNRCPFYDLCFTRGALENIQSDTGFEPRVAHHTSQLEMEEAA